MIKVWDNGGKTADRYTVLIDGHCFGMSENATSPNGFNQYIGRYQYGAAQDAGKRIDISLLPEPVRKAIWQRLEQMVLDCI